MPEAGEQNGIPDRKRKSEEEAAEGGPAKKKAKVEARANGEHSAPKKGNASAQKKTPGSTKGTVRCLALSLPSSVQKQLCYYMLFVMCVGLAS